MGTMLQEHGEVLVYGIIGVMVVFMICLLCDNQWKEITPEYKTAVSKDNSTFIHENENKYPVIEADEIIYAGYQTENFQCKDFIKARDCNGKDISEKVQIFGTIDTFRRGIYPLKCMVVDDNQLACTKYIHVIVE